MAEIAGSAIYLGWVTSGGTTLFAPHFRNFTWAPALNWIDATAGSDSYEVLLPSYGTGQEFSVTTVYQSGTTGINIATALDRGQIGTILYGPEGNAAGALKYSIPATSAGPQWNQPFNDVVEMTAAWRQTSAETRGTF